MHWIQIKKNEQDEWNNKLKSTNASFFQYPYYASAYKYFLFTSTVYLKLLNDFKEETGFCCIMKVQVLFLKIGLVIRGPVFFNNCNDFQSALSLLKQYARKHKYLFLRINPTEQVVEKVIACDKEFEAKDYFPVYRGAQLHDLLVYKRPEEQLLISFRNDCRHKIRFQEDLNYQYKMVSTKRELKEVYHLFETLGTKKNFSYRPFKSYKKIFFEGTKHGLCSIYTAHLNNEIICAAFIVKDGNSFTYLSGALMLNGIKAKFSPANNLHYLIIKDCFYKEQKDKYNLSYSSPASGVYMFKTSFKPVEEKRPEFYTYVVNKKFSDFILSLQQRSIGNSRKKIRKLRRRLQH